ncbi:cell division protein ZapD [Aquabacterium sp. CECT 9606]|uniref:cell division protein ZapD n=1 Tax=Aquabacterium sp. CECT 9606 TaxID=2845822 RepID=UPI001E48CA0A|nr:cell division protein ZapD [Aquabacterium sp. CECT 9606]CAH0354111.1 Cell division protein ZapD [Aquabacterium sp. CECT 9606]
MILYEYPFNESIRTMLRLEHLFNRLILLMWREHPTDHHYALATIFEIMDVASRADLKADLLKELDRFKSQFMGWRGNPAIQEAVLDQVLGRIEQTHHTLQQVPGKAGQTLASNDWLMSIRSRISIPGGTCEFDLPSYYAWQQEPAQRRQADLHQWAATLTPLAEALKLMLSLLRDTGHPHMVAAPAGSYQQSLKENKPFLLLRLRIDPSLGLVPEISGNRLMVAIRLMRQDIEGKLKLASDIDAAFELTLCA